MNKKQNEIFHYYPDRKINDDIAFYLVVERKNRARRKTWRLMQKTVLKLGDRDSDYVEFEPVCIARGPLDSDKAISINNLFYLQNIVDGLNLNYITKKNKALI